MAQEYDIKYYFFCWKESIKSSELVWYLKDKILLKGFQSKLTSDTFVLKIEVICNVI